MKKTLERIKRAFIWKKMRKEVGIFVAECEYVNGIRMKMFLILDCYNHYLSQSKFGQTYPWIL